MLVIDEVRDAQDKQDTEDFNQALAAALNTARLLREP